MFKLIILVVTFMTVTPDGNLETEVELKAMLTPMICEMNRGSVETRVGSYVKTECQILTVPAERPS